MSLKSCFLKLLASHFHEAYCVERRKRQKARKCRCSRAINKTNKDPNKYIPIQAPSKERVNTRESLFSDQGCWLVEKCDTKKSNRAISILDQNWAIYTTRFSVEISTKLCIWLLWDLINHCSFYGINVIYQNKVKYQFFWNSSRCGTSYKYRHTYYRQLQQIVLVARFGRVDHPQALKYVILKTQVNLHRATLKFATTHKLNKPLQTL